MDLLRRRASGRLAQLIGPSALPSDVQARVVGYTDAEYAAMFADLLDEQDRVVVVSLVEGINAWLAEVAADPERLLPAEYLLFSAFPEPWEVRDVLATAVDITRSVASAGGNEMTNVANLVTLQQAFPEEQARGLFQDLFWLEDAKAVTTVPGSSGRFPNSTSTPSEQGAVFEAMADYAETLPPALANGPGTGAYQPPPSGPGGRGAARAPGAMEEGSHRGPTRLEGCGEPCSQRPSSPAEWRTPRPIGAEQIWRASERAGAPHRGPPGPRPQVPPGLLDEGTRQSTRAERRTHGAPGTASVRLPPTAPRLDPLPLTVAGGLLSAGRGCGQPPTG